MEQSGKRRSPPKPGNKTLGKQQVGNVPKMCVGEERQTPASNNNKSRERIYRRRDAEVSSKHLPAFKIQPGRFSARRWLVLRCKNRPPSFSLGIKSVGRSRGVLSPAVVAEYLEQYLRK